MNYGSGRLNSAVDTSSSPTPAPPQLLLQLEPAHRVFVRNLAETLSFRRTTKLDITSPPASFWPDVFVSRRMPWLPFCESLLLHVAVLAGVWSLGRALALRPHTAPRVAFRDEDVIYYSPSEYLPPIDTGSTASLAPQHGEPEFARQPIISVPPEADNHSQTIVTPPNVRLDHDVPLPNIVAWEHPIPAPPLPNADALRVPNLSASVVAPPPDMTQVSTRRLDPSQAPIVAPAPAVTDVGTRALSVPQPNIIAPPPSVQNDVRTLGELNIGPARVVAPAPQLPVQAQRSLAGIATLASQHTKIIAPPPSAQAVDGLGTPRGTGMSASGMIGAVSQVAPPIPSLQGVRGTGRSAAAGAHGAVVPPPPSLAAGARASSSTRQLIALSLHPAVGAPPTDVAGNRRGAFAATPQGKPGAPGTPDIAANSHALGAHGGGNGGALSGRDAGLPAGIRVGPGPANAPAAQSASGSEVAAGPSGTDAPQAKTLLADNRPMRVTVSPRTATESSNPPSPLERQVFGDRRSYSMVLNMPNLNSAGGSWVIRFAELKESVAASQGKLIAPEPINKVDPGYPLELMRQNVKGTVTLYAVIHSDGTVGDVRVLNSPDDRLDEFARAALTRWHFRPAMKNGVPIALEAVVNIPFRPTGW